MFFPLFKYNTAKKNNLFFIAGPCVVESEALCRKIADRLAGIARQRTGVALADIDSEVGREVPQVRYQAAIDHRARLMGNRGGDRDDLPRRAEGPDLGRSATRPWRDQEAGRQHHTDSRRGCPPSHQS